VRRAITVAGSDELIVCADGYRLAARSFDPAPELDDGTTVVIAPATGAKASYYWRYGAYLASAGFRAVVADYRGVGGSAPRGSPRALRDLPVRWHHWGTLDLDAVIGWAQQRTAGEGRLVVVGHSFGGLAACLAPRAAAVSRLLMVGSQHAHWPDYARDQRLRMLWRWHVVMPAVAALVGYFPGRRLGWLEDIPRGVALDWARGHRDLGRTIGRADRDVLARCARLSLEVLAVAATDDPFATRAAMDRALSYLPAARKQCCLIDPAAVGADRIGHLGPFHDRFRDTLWPLSAQWLRGGSASCPAIQPGEPEYPR
jgi:predicted alpha/beta hydrolase